MTTEELIKALREKPSRDNRQFLDEVADYVEILHNAIFALNEDRMAQKAEIEEQASLITSLTSIKTTVINDAKAEAVKEFAERLNEKLEQEAQVVYTTADGFKRDFYEILETHIAIDNLVKEFTEGSGNG